MKTDAHTGAVREKMLVMSFELAALSSMGMTEIKDAHLFLSLSEMTLQIMLQ